MNQNTELEHIATYFGPHDRYERDADGVLGVRHAVVGEPIPVLDEEGNQIMHPITGEPMTETPLIEGAWESLDSFKSSNGIV